MAQYPLKQIKTLAKEGSIQINQNAKDSARLDFGFVTSDIVKTITRLSGRHYYKTAPSEKRPGTILDFYRTRHLGEDIYIHLYVMRENGKEVLVINSFKQLTHMDEN